MTETPNAPEKATMQDFERLMTEAYDEGVVTEVIRPAAILPEDAARNVLVELALHDVHANGVWDAQPSLWRRFVTPWDGPDGGPGQARLLGTMQVAYGTPTRYEITIYRATVTKLGQEQGLTVERLCDEALAFGGYTLADCPRAQLNAPPKPFRMPDSRTT